MSNENENLLLEANNLTFFGKLFFAGVASYLSGKSKEMPKIPIKIKASKEQIKAVMDIIKATKDLQDVIDQPDVPIEKVIEKITAKNQFKDQFKKMIKVEWPL